MDKLFVPGLYVQLGLANEGGLARHQVEHRGKRVLLADGIML